MHNSNTWTCITLGMLLVILIAFNIVLAPKKEEVMGSSGEERRVATFGDITWIGRVHGGDDEDREYELVRIDAKGNESVMYRTVFTEYSDVEWGFSNDGRNLVVTAVVAGVDAANYTEIGFIDGEEVIRSHYSSYETSLTLATPGSLNYTAVLITSDPCNGAVNSTAAQVVIPQTELLGVKVSSDEGSETFTLSEPKKVSCALGDGMFVDWRPQDVTTDVYGVSFRLPTGDKARLTIDDVTQKANVSFQSADAMY